MSKSKVYEITSAAAVHWALLVSNPKPVKRFRLLLPVGILLAIIYLEALVR